MEEVPYGGEGPHWAVVPMKNFQSLIKILRLSIRIPLMKLFCPWTFSF